MSANPPVEDRKAWMSLLARSGAEAARLLAQAGLETPHDAVRAPEMGSVMVRGRAGATGAPFNLGEMTVTRCTVRLADGVVGHGYVQGREADGARAAAVIDALMQTDVAEEIEAQVLGPLRTAGAERKAQRRKKAAATKVDFFTMVRGENA